uniref:FRY n=1 Tax=Caenorhabditis tropicalis TaxID=1561998 RepID=A0A1I7UJ84_9PELO
MNLRRRLENVTERAVLFQIIKDVMNDPESNGDVVEAFCESMDCFSKFLTDKEYTTALSPIIDKQCPIRSIIGLGKGLPTVSAMDTPTTFRDVMTVLGWVKQVAEHLPRVILDSITVRETDAETTQLFRDFAKAAMSLPDKMSNCTAKALTEDHIKYIDTVKWSFKKNVLSGMQEAMRIAHKKPASNLKTVSELLSAGRNMEVTSRHVLLGNIMEWIGSMENFDDRWTEIMCFMFREPTVLGVQVHEALLTSVFLSAKNEQTLTVQ